MTDVNSELEGIQMFIDEVKDQWQKGDLNASEAVGILDQRCKDKKNFCEYYIDNRMRIINYIFR